MPIVLLFMWVDDILFINVRYSNKMNSSKVGAVKWRRFLNLISGPTGQVGAES